MKATEQCCPMVLFIMLYKVGQIFSVCWMKSYGVSCGVIIQMKATEHTVYYAVKVVPSFKSVG